MKNLLKLFGVLYLAFFLVGCAASIAYHNEDVKNYESTDPSYVKVYSERDLSVDNIEIGYVAVHMPDGPNGDKMKKILQEKAAGMGADAIVGFRIFATTAEGVAVKFK